MRLLHTSDWHLGRRLCEVSRLTDQAAALDELYALCVSERVDCLVVAGDVYDRAIPPEDAVALFGDFLARVSRALGIDVVLISGNHDSAERLGFGAAILERGRVHLRTSFARRAEPVVVSARGETVPIYALPYLEPDVARARLDDPTLVTHDAAVRAALAAAHEDRARRRAASAVLVGHLFAQGGRESVDSERPLVVGGAAQVATSALAGWTYVALGHLHEPQAVGGAETIRYSGSLLKYAFAEAGQRKGVTLVEVARGGARVHELPLAAGRDLVRIEGTFDELLVHPRFEDARACYVEATYTDTSYLIDVVPRLRARFPHLLLALPKRVVGDTSVPAAEPPSARPADARDLLRGFWQHVVPGEPLPDELLGEFARVVGEVERGRHTGAPRDVDHAATGT